MLLALKRRDFVKKNVVVEKLCGKYGKSGYGTATKTFPK
jgi:hypothetical protein